MRITDPLAAAHFPVNKAYFCDMGFYSWDEIWQHTARKLELSAPKNAAGYIGFNRSFTCNILDDGTPMLDLVDVVEPYTVDWFFTPLGQDTSQSIKILNLTSEGSAKPRLSWTSDPYKYGTNSGIELMVFHLQVGDGVRIGDAGTYSCVIEGSGSIGAAELFVVDSLGCMNLKNPLNFVNQEQAKFECHVKYMGSKPPTLSWRHGNKHLNQTTYEHNATYVISTMSFVATYEDDGHVYYCHIEYPKIFSSYCSTSPPLKVYSPVHLMSMEVNPYTDNNNFKSGTDIRLICHAKGDPSPRYHWMFTPKNMSRPAIDVSHISRYTIRNAQPSNAGTYACTVTNVINGTKFQKTKLVMIDVYIVETSPSIGYRYFIAHQGSDSRSSYDQQNGNSKKEEGNGIIKLEISPYAVGAMVTAGLAVILIIVFIFLAMKFKVRDKKMKERFSRMHDELLDDQEVELLDENIQPRSSEEPTQYSQLRQCWEIPRKDIRQSELLARGVFVEVWKGRIRKFPDRDEVIRVAIKKLLPEATEKGRKFFLAEMEVAKVLQANINVIQLIGCYTLHEPWLLMLEYASEGTLYSFLQRCRPGAQRVEITTSSSKSSARLKNHKVDSHKMLAMSAQIVNGLQHISKFKLVCYRLRSASVLVAKGAVCKLSGFGFPQDVTERNQYEADSLPIRWMAPESLAHNMYSTQSDTWSLGIVMWEILHFGATPYPAFGQDELPDKVIDGYRLPPPPHCSDELYGVMNRCWSTLPENRPDYANIMTELTNLALEDSAHICLDKLPSFAKAPEHYNEEDSDSL
ncbi:fibroblast growth factor receptor 2-like [Ylistrum balloti]|uniref:fibroblast growth factor receptor 2-like n=1 Tax=Ylistrum balloti TaxID=509963 RepID=UPI0029057DA9|nr:fibroblast growth factor receptor 2-like [Ylistrum balloti]